ncbi:hypothetical protein BDZ89DRAFT_1037692 [Hymenopellis radicata]|nr:hypothetical protein BDZ89DRAFT_1037692 [Hymenopellis radicata]
MRGRDSEIRPQKAEASKRDVQNRGGLGVAGGGAAASSVPKRVKSEEENDSRASKSLPGEGIHAVKVFADSTSQRVEFVVFQVADASKLKSKSELIVVQVEDTTSTLGLVVIDVLLNVEPPWKLTWDALDSFEAEDDGFELQFEKLHCDAPLPFLCTILSLESPTLAPLNAIFLLDTFLDDYRKWRTIPPQVHSWLQNDVDTLRINWRAVATWQRRDGE